MVVCTMPCKRRAENMYVPCVRISSLMAGDERKGGLAES